MTTFYLFASTAAFFSLFLIWTGSSALNFSIKFTMGVLTVAGLLCFLSAVGVVLIR